MDRKLVADGSVRRRLLIGGAALGSSLAMPWSTVLGQGATGRRNDPPAVAASQPDDHRPFGPVVPGLPMPSMRVQTHDGKSIDLRELLRGRISALQLMFTGCSATCPIQGAVFAAAQANLQRARLDAQFVSVSIDPMSDTPSALAAWLKRHGAAADWVAVAPRLADLDGFLALLRGRSDGVDRHTAQTYIVGRRSELVYRTPEFWPPERIAELLKQAIATS